MDYNERDTDDKPVDNHWGFISGYLLIFSVVTMGDAGWLLGRYRGGDVPPHPLMITMCWCILGLSISSLFFFFILAGLYPVKKVSGKGLWACLMAWSLWVAASIALTVLYKGTYNCYKYDSPKSVTKYPFAHCNQVVCLQAFSWIMVSWITCIPMMTADKPPKVNPIVPRGVPNARRREPHGLQEGEGNIELNAIRGGRNEADEERGLVGPPEPIREGNQASNLWSLPGPPDAKPKVGT